MKILVTGANGFIGSEICRLATLRQWQVVALTRPNREFAGSHTLLTHREAELHDLKKLRVILKESKPDAIIHCAAVVSTGRPDLEKSLRINVEGTKNLLSLAEEITPKARWIQISSMSAHPANKSVYGATKWASEEIVRQTFLPWTIFKPSLVYGPQKRGIFHKMASIVQKSPIIPLLGFGNEPMRPVHVEDLCRAVLNAIPQKKSIHQTYEIGGPEDWTYRQVLTMMAPLMKKNAPFLVPMPLPIARVLATAQEIILPNPVFTTDNLEGIAKAQPLNILPAMEDLDFQPRNFEEGFLECLEDGLLK